MWPIVPKVKKIIDSSFFDYVYKYSFVLLGLIAAFTFCFFLYYLLSLPTTNDDLIYGEYSIGMSFYKEHYFGWSSRLLIETLLIFFSHHFLIFKLAVVVCYVALATAFLVILNIDSLDSLADLKNINYKWNKLFVSLAVCALIPYGYLNEAGIIATFTNYIVPLVALIWGFICLIWFKRITFVKVTLVILLLLLAFDHEQYCVFAFLTIIPLYLSKRVDKKLFAIFVVLCLVSLVYHFTCPGNSVRLTREITRWLPEFTDYSVFDKVKLGFIVFYERTFVVNFYVAMLFIGALVFTILLTGSSKRKFFISIAVVVLISFFYLKANRYIPRFFCCNRELIYSFITYKFVKYYALLLVSILVAMSLINATWTCKIILVSCLIAASAATIVLGFSPTVFSSGCRTTFLYCTVLVFLALILLYRRDNSRLLLVSNVFLALMLVGNFMFFMSRYADTLKS